MWVAALVVQVLPVSFPALAQCDQWLLAPTFETPIGADDDVLAAVSYTSPQGGGTPWIVVAGRFRAIGGRDIHYLAAWDGVTWRDIGATHSISLLNDQVLSLTVYNGRLIAGGWFTRAGATDVNHIAQWNGFTWEAMGSGMTNLAPHVALISDLQVFNGELVACGRFDTAGGASIDNIAKWNGTMWSGLGSGMPPLPLPILIPVVALEVFNGQLIAGGRFQTAGGVAANHIAKWNGSVWSPLGAGFGDPDLQNGVYALCVSGGFLYAGGLTARQGGLHCISRWNGSSWSDLGSGVDGTVLALAPHLGGVLVGGAFGYAGGVASNQIAHWTNGGTWNAFPPGLNANGTVWCLAVVGGPILMGGEFIQTAGGSTLNHVALVNGSTFFPFHEAAPSIFAMTTFNGRVYAGGSFLQPGAPDNRNIARWDGVSATGLSTGMNGPVSAIKGFTSGTIPFQSKTVVAGGGFTTAGGVAVSNIAAWIEGPQAFPPPQWNAMGTGLNGGVAAIERFSNSTYAAGGFTQSGTTSALRIARFDGTNWVAVGTGLNGTAHALKVYSNQLYVGGSFTGAGGVATGGLARWNGTAWSMVGGNFVGIVYALEVYNGELVIGGQFPGLTGSPNIVKYNGSVYSTLGSGGTSAAVRSLAVNGTKLYLGGDFTTAGGVSAARLARWSSTTGWQSVRAGSENSVRALTSIQNEVHGGGASDGITRFAAWKRYTTDGVPWLIQQPFLDEACQHSDVSCSVRVAAGYTIGSLTWRHDGLPLALGPTGTGSTVTAAGLDLNIINVGSADAGSYTCTVTNACGSVTSNPATLTVCTADFNCDGSVDPDDLSDFITCFFLDVEFPGTCPEADFNGDGFRDPDDLSDFITAFFTSTC